MTTSFYNQLITVNEKYLGPAAERFVRRQINFHLEKKPEDITRADVVKLADSIKTALEILTQDKTMVDDAVREMNAVAKQGLTV